MLCGTPTKVVELKSHLTTQKHARMMLLNTSIAANVKLAINSFPRHDFPRYISVTFGQFPDIPSTAVKLPDSYTQRVTLQTQ